MLIHADFSQRAVVDTNTMDWVPSPMPGVERKMLDRIGGEMASRATTVVRYAPGSRFSEHTHSDGEEFYVLEGTFSDQSGDFPAGTYVRNPIGTAHAPHSDDGCIIWVKLQQFEGADQVQKNIDTVHAAFQPGAGQGITVLPLHNFGSEEVYIERWEAGTKTDERAYPDGMEMLVLEGKLEDELGSYSAGTWLRMPPGSSHHPASKNGCRFLVKVGHLTGMD